jgi:predicted  nucleic acid-binding Zn-ribbon protein
MNSWSEMTLNRAKLSKILRSNESLKKEKHDSEVQLEAKKQQMKDQTNKLSMINNKNDELLRSINELHHSNNNVDHDIQKLIKSIESLTSQDKSLDNDLTDMEKQHSNDAILFEEERTKLKQELAVRQENKATLDSEIDAHYKVGSHLLQHSSVSQC